MKKILLTGHGGSYNRGCEAIIRTTLDMIRSEFNEPRITIASTDFENEKLVDFGPNVKIIPSKKTNDRWSFSWMIRQFRRILSKTYRDNYWQVKYSPLIPYLKEADVVLSVGGDNYSMDYGFPTYFLELNQLVKLHGKKLIIWGASIGPFLEDNRLEEIVRSLSSADLITIRESASKEYLAKFGVIKNVRGVADPAFLLPLKPIEKNILDNVSSEGVLGFNISPIYSQYKKLSHSNINILDEIIDFLAEAIKRTDMTIALIPHVTKKDSFNNDYNFMGPIYDALKGSKKIIRIPDHYATREMKYIISKCRFFIGARTHATIAALSSEVPTLSLGYSMKARGINNDIFSSLDYVIEADDLTKDNLLRKLNLMVQREDVLRKVLGEKIPAIKKSAYQNIIFLKNLRDPYDE